MLITPIGADWKFTRAFDTGPVRFPGTDRQTAQSSDRSLVEPPHPEDCPCRAPHESRTSSRITYARPIARSRRGTSPVKASSWTTACKPETNMFDRSICCTSWSTTFKTSPATTAMPDPATAGCSVSSNAYEIQNRYLRRGRPSQPRCLRRQQLPRASVGTRRHPAPSSVQRLHA